MKIMKVSLFLYALLTFTTVAHGQTIAEKKAMRLAQETINKDVESVRAACGNPKLVLQVDFAAYSKLADYAKRESRTVENMMSLSSTHANTILSLMKGLCSDPDYKAELAKINVIQLVPIEAKTKPYMRLKKDGQTIVDEQDASRSPNSMDAQSAVKALF